MFRGSSIKNVPILDLLLYSISFMLCKYMSAHDQSFIINVQLFIILPREHRVANHDAAPKLPTLAK